MLLSVVEGIETSVVKFVILLLESNLLDCAEFVSDRCDNFTSLSFDKSLPSKILRLLSVVEGIETSVVNDVIRLLGFFSPELGDFATGDCSSLSLKSVD